MAEAFEKLTSFFMTPKCHEELFYKFNFINVVCLKMIISKCLGYGILAGSVLLRVPQIFKIVKANSAEGMSVPSELLQQIAVFGTMSYGFSKQFPISAYGDSYFLFLQGFIILLLVLFYQQKIASLIVVLVLILGSTGLLFLNMIPYEVIFWLNGLSLFLSVAGKLIQARENWINSSTGVLSAFTLILQFLGCVARIFTSIQETGDSYMVLTYIAVSLANGILVWQLYYYWNSDKAKKDKRKKKQ